MISPSGEEEEGDADDRDEGGGSDEDEVETDVEAGRGVKRKNGLLRIRWNTRLPTGSLTLIVMRVSERRWDTSRPRRVRSSSSSRESRAVGNVFVVRDVYSGIRTAYPTSDGFADEVVRCMKEFMARQKIRVAHGDHAPQFVSA